MGTFLSRGRRAAMALLCGLTLASRRAATTTTGTTVARWDRTGARTCRPSRGCSSCSIRCRSDRRRPGVKANGGFGLDMWATVVDRSGIVRVVAFSGAKEGDQWPASRVISAQKANTANSLSLDGLALSTANLYSAVQPGGSLFGLQESNPVNTDVGVRRQRRRLRHGNDFMLGKRIGGVNVFGGGLALYDATGQVIGAIGLSGDSSCADHIIAVAAAPRAGAGLRPGRRRPAPAAPTTSCSTSTAAARVRADGAIPPARPMRRRSSRSARRFRPRTLSRPTPVS